MKTVFLSYAQENLSQIKELIKSLYQNEITLWYDVESIRGGKLWPKAIGEAINSNEYFLLFWSNQSSQSHFVQLEWNTAIALKKNIIPVTLDDIQLPSFLCSINAIKFTNTKKTSQDIINAVSDSKAKSTVKHSDQVIDILGKIDSQDPQIAVDESIKQYIKNNWLDSIKIIFERFRSVSSPLKSYIRIKEFETIIKERTKDFVGREFIFNKIDEITSNTDFPSGYILIKGEPGIGKTALIAQLVKQNGYVHHFNSSTDNIRSTNAFLLNICAQLIIKYNLDHNCLPNKVTKDSGFLVELLGEVKKKVGNKKVIIVVDALDEADILGLPPDANRLYLPRIIPEGVFFVVTMREKYEERLYVERKECISIDDSDPNNISDIEKYIINYLSHNNKQMYQRLKELQINEDHLKGELIKKSEGNFQYIRYVLPAIKDRRLNLININNIKDLPTGLRDLYARHWKFMKSKDTEKYKRLQKPVLCFLASALEPVNIKTIIEWIRKEYKYHTPDATDVLETIKEWREFLNSRQSEKGEEIYHIYHNSFKDFLDEEEGLSFCHKVIYENVIQNFNAMKKA